MGEPPDQSAVGEAARPEASPSHLGPYRLIQKLGAGAMGTVWLAEEEGRKVALKVLHPHLSERQGFFKRFGREARAGRRVRHPNVVRTLDSDLLFVEDRAACVLVMEYVEGRTLRDLLRELGTVPEALLREIARQIAAGLEAIHAEGLIHRDLKPDNVLITEDHRVRIMDLGIAKEREASMAITKEGQFAGSLLYAAPEQIQHGDVGPAADLYALGVTLYELATGRNPFRHDDASAVIHAHLNEPAWPMVETCPDVSAFFAELVATLLAKDAEKRFESADALRIALAEEEGSSWWAVRERALRESRPALPIIPVRRETKLYGRQADLALLQELWESACEGGGSTVLLEGEAGIGKTRLVDAFLKGLAGDAAHVLYGSHPPFGGLGGLTDAILGQFGRADLEERLAPYLHEMPLLAPGFAALLRREEPPSGAVSLQGDAVNAVFANLLRALAKERPVLWIVEDLHFASVEGRRIALSLARVLAQERVLLLLSTRPGLPDEELAHFSRLDSFRRMALGRLSPREVVDLLRDAFQSEALAERLGVKIAHKSDGIPFFIFEMVRGLRDGQFITQLPDGSYVESKIIEDIEVPSAVKDLIEVRIRDLTKGQRAILDVGAVQGFAFDPGLVAAVLERRPMAVLQDLADMERRSGIIRAAGRSYRFDHHQIQEVLYGDLHESLRAEYHSAVARRFAARIRREEGDGAGVPGEDAFFLAWHGLRGRTPADGLSSLWTALRHLESSGRWEEEEALGRLALDADGLLEGTERIRALLDRTRCLAQLGRQSALTAPVDEARTLAEVCGERSLLADVELVACNALCVFGHLGDAAACARRSMTVAQDARDQARVARATFGISVVHLASGRLETAKAGFERTLDLAREAGLEDGVCRARDNLGVVAMSRGRLAEARAIWERGLASARGHGDGARERRALCNLGTVCTQLGQCAEARTYLEQGLQAARGTGDRPAELALLGALGQILHQQGSHAEATGYYERSVLLAQETGRLSEEAIVTGNLGLLLADQCRLGEAKECFERHRALSEQIGAQGSRGVALVNLGSTLLTLGDAASARSTLEESLSLNQEVQARKPEAHALLGLAKLEDEEGRTGPALELAQRALEIFRDISHAKGTLAALQLTGGLAARLGDLEQARSTLDESLGLAEELGLRVCVARALGRLACLPAGDVESARVAIEEVGNEPDALDVWLDLWRATRNPDQLRRAKRLLDYRVEHSPEEYRKSMLENVRLHREIESAWKALRSERAEGESKGHMVGEGDVA